MRNYETAKTLLGFMTFLGWAAIVAAAVIFVTMVGTFPFGAILGISLIVAVQGMVVVVMAQMGHAQIETAENTRDFVTLLREMSRTGVVSQRSDGHNTASPMKPSPSPNDGGMLVEGYKGYTIRRNKAGRPTVNGRVFQNVLEAKEWINENPME